MVACVAASSGVLGLGDRKALRGGVEGREKAPRGRKEKKNQILVVVVCVCVQSAL